jgi:hypothetical protein
VFPPGEYASRIFPFKNNSQVIKNPGLHGVSGTPQQANGGTDNAVSPETDFVA